MPRFYLHLHNAHIDAIDTEGVDVDDLDAARDRAIAGIRDFIGHEAMAGKLDLRGRIDIADATETTIATVRFPEAFTIRGADTPLNEPEPQT